MDKSIRFIAATENFNTFDAPVPAPYLRKSFISDTEAAAQLEIAACGFYELFFNGEKITKGFLAPYISNTDDNVYFDTYEIRLNKGENVIGIILGNGFQNNPGGYIWDFDKASFRSAPKFSLKLSLNENGNETVLLTSDSEFKTHPSPILNDDYRFGVSYNSNLEIKGWNEKDFDDSDWSNAISAETPKGELKPCTVEPIVSGEERKPISIFKEDDGYVYDFGVSDAGVCRLCINGKKGQEVVFRYADILKNGKFFLENMWFVRDMWERDKELVHKDTYICHGDGIEYYTPIFIYHGFRYVKVTGITPEQATEELLTYVPLHSDLKSRGGFSCSDDITNKLQEMTRRSDLSNFHYFPTDCPQREKNGWTADAALSCEQLLLNFTAENSYREWLDNIRKAQNAEGALPGIVPTGGWGFEWVNGPAWDCVLAYLPYFTYVLRGETEMITESAVAFIRYLDYLSARKDENGLLHIGLGDWCHAGRGADDPKAPLEVTDSIISFDIADKIAFMLKAVGNTDGSAKAERFAAEMRTAVRANLIDFNTLTVKGECQTSQAMALFYGIFEPEEKPKAFNALLRFVHEADDHLDVGVLGGRVIFRVLSDFGYADLAFKMITRTDFPSYGNWIARGATTLWESFLPDSVDSPNHHFWGDISAWFIEYLAGINYNHDRISPNTVLIAPKFVDSLQNAEGFYEAPLGKIFCRWKRDGDKIRLTLEIPEGVKAIYSFEGYFLTDCTDSELKTGEYLLEKISD